MNEYIMNKPLFIFFICFFITVTISSQTILTGRVLDGDNKYPIASATIIAKYLQEKNIVSYTLSDSIGNFSIQLQENNKAYEITISSLGYQSFSLIIFNIGENNKIDTTINLTHDNYLQAIEVKAYKTGIIVNGDTIIYDVRVFTNGSEQNVEDILKKIPGLTITEEGDIKVGTQEISTLLLQGDGFMNSNRKGILKGINARDVASVEIIRDYYSDDSSLLISDEANKSQRIALNIILDTTALEQIKLSTTIGTGYNKIWRGDLSSYYIGSKGKLFINTRTNNTGEHIVSLSDYLTLQGDIFNSDNQKKTIPSIFFNQQEANKKSGLFTSLNYTHQLYNKWRFSGYLFHLNTNYSSILSKNEYFPFVDIKNSFDKERARNQNALGSEFRTQYRFSNESYLKYSINLIQNSSKDTEVNNAILDSKLFFNENFNQEDIFSLNQILAYSVLLNKHHKINLEGISILSTNRQYKDITSDSSLPFSVFLFRTEQNKAEQLNRDWDKRYNLNAKYTLNIKLIALETSLQYKIQNSKRDWGKINTKVDTIHSKKLMWDGEHVQLREQIQYQMNRFSLKGGILLQYFTVPTISGIEKASWRYHPTGMLNFNGKDNLSKLNITLNNETEISNIALSLNNVELNSINQISLYNIQNQFISPNSSFSLLFSRFNPLKGSTLFLFSRYNTSQHLIDKPSINTSFVINNKVLTPPQNTLMNGLLFDKRIPRLGLQTRTNILNVWQNIYTITENIEIKNRDAFFIIGTTLSTNRDSSINLQLQGEYKLGIYRVASNVLDGSKLQGQLDLNGYAFKNRILWSIGLAYIREMQLNQMISYHNLRGSFLYQPYNTSWAISLVFNDILNLDSPDRLSFSRTSYALITNEYKLFPGFLAVNFIFRL